jgi:serine/threonine protein kinase
MHFSVVGSPDYMAVEVLRGDGYTSCVDFWAIGCMMSVVRLFCVFAHLCVVLETGTR